MKEWSTPKAAAVHAAAALAYIATLVATVNFKPLSDAMSAVPLPLKMMTVLSTLVFSAAVMAMIFFARPAALAMAGKKKEAAMFVGWTLAFLFTFMLVIVAAGLLFTQFLRV